MSFDTSTLYLIATMLAAMLGGMLVLFGKQILYIERYLKGMAPGYAMLQDPFLIKNIFPEEAAKKAAELGVDFPD